ncbi:MAG: glycosyltransferase family 39 protein [Cytophagales bacterium]|nr:glycosyltransferase family 39 protein [Cytophagales bacterium]
MKINFILGGLLLSALIVRSIQLEERVLWFDENQTLLEANGIGNRLSFPPDKTFLSADFKREKSIQRVAAANSQRDSGNGVLYIFVVSAWTEIFGNSALSVRMISVFFSILSAVVIFFLARLLFTSDRMALWTVLIFGLHHMALISAQEARSYAMTTFLVVLSFYLFWVICNREAQSRWWTVLAYGVCSGAALLSHYFAGYILATEILVAILFFRKGTIWIKLVMGGMIASFMLIGWLAVGGLDGFAVMTVRNAAYQTLSQRDPSNPLYAVADFRTITAGFFQMVTHLAGIGMQNAGFRIREAIPFLALPFAVFFMARKSIVGNRATFLALIFLFFSAPLLAVAIALISKHTISFQVLYANFSLPFACILLGASLGDLWNRGNGAKTIVLAYLLLIILSAYISVVPERHGKTQGKNYEKLAMSLEADYRIGDTLVHRSTMDAIHLNLHFKRRDIIQRVDSVSEFNKIKVK